MKNLFLKAKLFLTTLWQSLQQKLGSLKIPFVQKPVSLRTILISLLVIIAVLLVVGMKSCSKTPAVTVIPVTTAIPLAQEIRSFAIFDGLVDPFLTVNLEARVKGYLTKIGFADGAMVKKGDLLFV
ncbi:MAG: efflux RND transporter periplasmic adaptor subunit, partial [Betaproteobacteria bacterium]|nr:efflux RND transporter periplasmic adaptor subunit [Betaproteobacteria bacterium]